MIKTQIIMPVGYVNISVPDNKRFSLFSKNTKDSEIFQNLITEIEIDEFNNVNFYNIFEKDIENCGTCIIASVRIKDIVRCESGNYSALFGGSGKIENGNNIIDQTWGQGTTQANHDRRNRTSAVYIVTNTKMILVWGGLVSQDIVFEMVSKINVFLDNARIVSRDSICNNNLSNESPSSENYNNNTGFDL